MEMDRIKHNGKYYIHIGRTAKGRNATKWNIWNDRKNGKKVDAVKIKGGWYIPEE